MHACYLPLPLYLFLLTEEGSLLQSYKEDMMFHILAWICVILLSDLVRLSAGIFSLSLPLGVACSRKKGLSVIFSLPFYTFLLLLNLGLIIVSLS